MRDPLDFGVQDGVAVLSLDNPPVNALGTVLRASLWAAVERAEADPAVRALLIRAEGRMFSAGADVREFGQPAGEPGLGALCSRIEACTKPVIAAIHGKALGGGFELALGAHYRIMADDAQIGLPEIALGILPGAGGTQRAPRLAGIAALEMMLSGKPTRAAQAQASGLADRVVAAEALDQAARDWAAELAAAGAPPRPVRARRDGLGDPASYLEAVEVARQAARSNPVPATARIADLAEAVLTVPFDTGLAMERAAFLDCVATDQARALRHAFFAERRAAKVPELAEGRARNFDVIGIIGGGLMGAGIAAACLDAGLSVTLVERDADALGAGLDRVRAIAARALARGRIDAPAHDAQMARLSGGADMAALARADLVIEAVIEDEAVKRDVLAAADRAMRPGAILATNTSYLDIDALARATSRPEDFAGFHFFSPAHVMKLVEVVVGRMTAPDVVATGFALAKRLGKIAVRAGVADGFIGNRLLAAYRQAADFMLIDGASPYEIDAAMRVYGFGLGPYQVLDMAGLDISWARRKRLARDRDPAHRYVAIGDKMCERGWLGQKAGRGYYTYPDGPKSAQPHGALVDLIAEERQAAGIQPRHFAPAEIQARCVWAMANEGARLIEAGVALRPSDIDVAMLAGYAFPRHHGGPMMAADLADPLSVRNALAGWAPEAPDFWTPAPLFDDLIRNGRHFSDLNGD